MKPALEKIKTDEWAPEIGVECEAIWGAKAAWHECVILPRGEIAGLGWVNEVRCMPEMPSIEFRPIKSEREQFIEAGLLTSNCREDDHTAIGIFKDMYDSGKFKLVEHQK